MDPRVITKYCIFLHKELQYHKTPQKCETLNKASQLGTWTTIHKEQYNRIDQTITKAMLHAERKVGKVSSGKFQWSPTLKRAVQAYRYWRLHLKQSHGQKNSESVLDSLKLAGGVPDLPSDSQAAVVQQLRQAYHTMMDHQRHSDQLRASFLKEINYFKKGHHH
jgi:hypothetical protein